MSKRQEEFFNWNSDIETKEEIIMINDNSSAAKKNIAKVMKAYIEAFCKPEDGYLMIREKGDE